MPVGSFRIEMVDNRDDGYVFKLEGDADIQSHTILMSSLVHAARRQKTSWLILDCSGLESIGSCGLGVVVLSHLLMKARHGAVMLVGARPLLQKSLQQTGLDKVIPVIPSVEEAHQWFAANVETIQYERLT